VGQRSLGSSVAKPLSVTDQPGELLPGGFVFGIFPYRVRVRVLRLLPIVHSEVIVAKLFMNLGCIRAAVPSPIKITLGAAPFPTPHFLLSCVKKTTQFEDLQFDRCIVISVRCIEFTTEPVSVSSDNVEAILTQCDSTFAQLKRLLHIPSANPRGVHICVREIVTSWHVTRIELESPLVCITCPSLPFPLLDYS